MREKISFKPVKQVSAATGVKISAVNIENVVSGMPILAAKKEDIKNAKEQIRKEVEEVLTETDKEGIIIKADSLGSLEALAKLLKESNILINKASIGSISKK